LVNALIAHCGAELSGIGGVRRPGIVHRLDKDTSGLLVAAKSDYAHHALAAQFAAHTIERSYVAVVWGVPRPREGRLTGNIGRNPRNRKKMAVVQRGGKTAVTHYRVLQRLDDRAAVLECRLETGRTHQIRVHLAAAGHPVVGDPTYGGATRARLAMLPKGFGGLERQALHAKTLGFRHPRSAEFLRFESALPIDIKELIDRLEKI
jgi:23S rRNA pseudouridine1911/1915/1917 synthase